MGWYNEYMTTFDIQIDVGALSKFGLVREGLTDAVRETLNDMAFLAARAQRRQLGMDFTLRNRWIENSIWPQFGKRKGLVPMRAPNIMRMYSTSGTNSPLLEKQESGWSKTDPMVPSREARVSRSEKRVIRKQFRKREIDSNRTLRYSKQMQEVHDPKQRISMLLAVANAINWKGLIHIENDSVMPEGFYKFRGRSLKLLRRIQHGRKARRAITWHEDAIRASRLNGSAAATIYATNARQKLSHLR